MIDQRKMPGGGSLELFLIVFGFFSTAWTASDDQNHPAARIGVVVFYLVIAWFAGQSLWERWRRSRGSSRVETGDR